MSEPESIKTNVPEFSVSELAFSLKRTLEDNFGRVRVRGELSRVSIAASGHMYSSLKDDQAVIDSVCWKGTMAKLSVRPEEGLEVICTGRISTYPQRSNYQLIIESMELAGEGALLKMLEERRKRLAAEGLFDEARKKPLPFLPEVIGVITSPTGAVIRDILHRLADRFPRHVLVWPVMVQGEQAAAQIAEAIDGFQNSDLRGLPRPDVLIVARGGGSLEDLMAFNDEAVVRAAANSVIPLISAVGHETDTTLIDYAADMRAPTPTGAAEMAVPVRAQLLAQVMENEQRLLNAASRLTSELRHRLEGLSRGLRDPARLLETKAQRLDHLSARIDHAFKQALSDKKHRLIGTASSLRHPRELLRLEAGNLKRWSEQLTALAPKLTREADTRLQIAGKMLEAYSYENVLQRGFVVVRDENGAVVTNAARLNEGDVLELSFKAQQKRIVTVGNTPENQGTQKKQPKKSAAKNAAPKNTQQSLF